MSRSSADSHRSPGPAAAPARSFSAFAGPRRLATGPLSDVAAAAAEVVAGSDGAPDAPSVLIVDDATGRPVDVDLRGGERAVRARAAARAAALDGVPATASGGTPDGARGAPGRRRRGRPRLGVVGKEVTLLPRHWAWLDAQPGGASATLRRLVEDARRAGGADERVREARDAAYRFMAAVCGDLPGYEEALRALFRGRADAFAREIRAWPPDLRDHAASLATRAFDAPSTAAPADPG